MQDTLKIVFGLIVAVLIADILGFMAWIMSGQHPIDGFYLGSITAHTLKALISVF